jgi:hypothetical protein
VYLKLKIEEKRWYGVCFQDRQQKPSSQEKPQVLTTYIKTIGKNVGTDIM